MAKRGSDVLLKRCKGSIEEDMVSRLAGLIDEHGARCVGWECVGQPQPDAVFGIAQAADLDTTLNLLRDLAKLDLTLTFEIFPRGIPYPEFFDVHFRTPGFNR